MTAILKEDPATLPVVARHIPSALERIVGRCLEKNSAARFKSADDLAFALESVSSQPDSAAAATITRGRKTLLNSAGVAWVMAGISLVVAAVLAVPTFLYIRRATPEPVVTRLDVVTPPTTSPASFALSPDGRQLVFVANGESGSQLWIRPLDQVDGRSLAGTQGATYPFWSPDGRAIGFFADTKLKRMAVAGGAPAVIADAPAARGATWSPEGLIVFAPSLQVDSCKSTRPVVRRCRSRGSQPARAVTGGLSFFLTAADSCS